MSIKLNAALHLPAQAPRRPLKKSLVCLRRGPCTFRTKCIVPDVLLVTNAPTGGLLPPAQVKRTKPSAAILFSLDGPFDKIINYTRNVIIRTHGDYFSQTKAASGLNRSIGCVEILYGL